MTLIDNTKEGRGKKKAITVKQKTSVLTAETLEGDWSWGLLKLLMFFCIRLDAYSSILYII